MSRWRGRAGQAGAEKPLQQTIRAGLEIKTVKPSQLKRVNVDTTVQEKNVCFPTDSRLYDRARERLVKAARTEGHRVAPELRACRQDPAQATEPLRAGQAVQAGDVLPAQAAHDPRSGHPRHRTQARWPGRPGTRRVVGAGQAHPRPAVSRQEEALQPTACAPRRGGCISKGKAHKRYEFGVKVSVATTSRGGWHVGAMSFPGNPYDGHMLDGALQQIGRILGKDPEHAFVDQGYRGHGCAGPTEVHIDKKRRGTHGTQPVEADETKGGGRTGHRPSQGRTPHGSQSPIWRAWSDMVNAPMSAAGMNSRKLLKHAGQLWRRIFGLLLAAIRPPQSPPVTWHRHRRSPTSRFSGPTWFSPPGKSLGVSLGVILVLKSPEFARFSNGAR